MNDQASVLIVDSSEENREVLTTVLQRRGVRTYTAGRVGQGLELARQHHPEVIVLDLEFARSGAEDVTTPFAEQSRADSSRLVMLGTLRRCGGRGVAGDFLAKPYHYGALIRKIEELLETAEAAR